MATPQNGFLNSLPSATLALLTPHLQRSDLPLSREVHVVDEAIDAVWFPETALLSMLVPVRSGDSVEAAMIGREGVAGLIETAGSGRASATALVQVDGAALSAPAAVCRRLLRDDEAFAQATWRAVEFQMTEARQSALCQALHPVEERLARWLIECHDRVGGRSPLPLTQEFLAAMLGVQRTTVNAFAHLLQKAGLIRYSRGSLQILDTEGLARRACECRDVVRGHRQRLGLLHAEPGRETQAGGTVVQMSASRTMDR